MILEMGSESFGNWLFHEELCAHHSENDKMALLYSLWVDGPRILTPSCRPSSLEILGCQRFVVFSILPYSTFLLVCTSYRLTFPLSPGLTLGVLYTSPLILPTHMPLSHSLIGVSHCPGKRPLCSWPSVTCFPPCSVCSFFRTFDVRLSAWHSQGESVSCGCALTFSKDENQVQLILRIHYILSHIPKYFTIQCKNNE